MINLQKDKNIETFGLMSHDRFTWRSRLRELTNGSSRHSWSSWALRDAKYFKERT